MDHLAMPFTMPFMTMTMPPASFVPTQIPGLESFAKFSMLAVELRLKIWSLAFEPRIVSVRYLPTKKACISSTTSPTLLSVNREARTETLRRYKLLFGTPEVPSKIYFNPDLDTIYLPRYRDMGYDETLRDFRCYLRQPEEMNDVKWLALDHVEPDIKRPWESYDKAILIKSFMNLRSIFLVLGPGRRLKDARGRSVSPFVIKKKIEFVVPQDPPEEILKIWANFRNAFSREESLIAEMFHSSGLAYQTMPLPAVTVVTKNSR